jgi:ribulose-phosphate 3-epimerase
MIEIIPAIMADSFVALHAMAAQVVGLVPVVQIDVMDGIFVPSTSWPYCSRDTTALQPPTTAVATLPLRQQLVYEVDLMVAAPAQAAPAWIQAGAHRVVVHLESLDDPATLLALLRGRYGDTVEVGIALGVDTPAEAIIPWVSAIDVVQCMGIATIGYQGQPFEERVIPKIRQIRAAHPDVALSVDGGVSLDTAPRLIAAGANRLVSGSAIFQSGNIAAAIEQFKQCCRAK